MRRWLWLVGLLASLQAVAETQYWMSVGSFKELPNAEEDSQATPAERQTSQLAVAKPATQTPAAALAEFDAPPQEQTEHLTAAVQQDQAIVLTHETTNIAPTETLRIRRYLGDQPPVTVDGRLDEPIWRELPAFDEFVVLEPDTLERGPYATRVRFLYTDQGLYVGVAMEQPKHTLIKRLSGRDVRELNRDSITITLDTSGEGRYAFWFGVNLGDSLMDGTAIPERQFSSEWDGPWRGASAETGDGWSAEFFIPWGTVSMPASGDARKMGVYLSRKVAHLDQRWGWPALPSTQPKFL